MMSELSLDKRSLEEIFTCHKVSLHSFQSGKHNSEKKEKVSI